MRRPWFAFRLAVAALSVASVTATPATARHDCNVPLADWQPREALKKKLEAAGWSVLSIRSDDGCYKVRAIDAQGVRLKAKFDPARLERIPSRDDVD